MRLRVRRPPGRPYVGGGLLLNVPRNPCPNSDTPWSCGRRRGEQQGAAAQCSVSGGGVGAGGVAAAIPAVCRRWRRVWNSSALLHGTLSLDLHRLEAQLCGPADEASLLRLLAQRGAAARRLWLHREGSQHLRMAAVLRLVSPQLQAVSAGCTGWRARLLLLQLRQLWVLQPDRPVPLPRCLPVSPARPPTPAQAYLGLGAPADALAHLRRFIALRSLDLPAAAYAEGQLSGFTQLEELTLREGVSQGLLR